MMMAILTTQSKVFWVLIYVVIILMRPLLLLIHFLISVVATNRSLILDLYVKRENCHVSIMGRFYVTCPLG